MSVFGNALKRSELKGERTESKFVSYNCGIGDFVIIDRFDNDRYKICSEDNIPKVLIRPKEKIKLKDIETKHLIPTMLDQNGKERRALPTIQRDDIVFLSVRYNDILNNDYVEKSNENGKKHTVNELIQDAKLYLEQIDDDVFHIEK